jgi:hypothetical protein
MSVESDQLHLPHPESTHALHALMGTNRKRLDMQQLESTRFAFLS